MEEGLSVEVLKDSDVLRKVQPVRFKGIMQDVIHTFGLGRLNAYNLPSL